MNWVGVLILAALAAELLLITLADFLNPRSAGTEVPADFRDVYDPARYLLTRPANRAPGNGPAGGGP